MRTSVHSFQNISISQQNIVPMRNGSGWTSRRLWLKSIVGQGGVPNAGPSDFNVHFILTVVDDSTSPRKQYVYDPSYGKRYGGNNDLESALLAWENEILDFAYYVGPSGDQVISNSTSTAETYIE